LDVLAKLDAERTPVWVQIEGTPARFKSRVLLKDDQVVFGKPGDTNLSLSAGSHVRFRVPEDSEHEVRLEVFAPHVNLSSGTALFLCRIPTGGLHVAKRREDRVGVAHLTNVALVMPKSDREFRLTDISLTGCRISIPPGEAKTIFSLGRPLGDVHIQVGAKAKVELESIVPRSYQPGAVGCEFAVKGAGNSQLYLERMIEPWSARSAPPGPALGATRAACAGAVRYFPDAPAPHAPGGPGPPTPPGGTHLAGVPVGRSDTRGSLAPLPELAPLLLPLARGLPPSRAGFPSDLLSFARSTRIGF
jgi:hypothetical protein